MATTTIATSGPFALGVSDVLKGLILAALVPAIDIIIQTINTGSLTFDWKRIGIAALSGFLAYLIKNFFTPAQIVIKDPPKAQVEAVEKGEAEAKVIPTK